MKFQAAIFDMDGLLLDTERVCMQVFQQACEAVSQPFFKETYLQIIGRNAAGIDQVLRATYGDNLNIIHQEWRSRYEAVVMHQAIPVKTGVVDMLDWLSEQNIPLAVATSTAKPVAEVKLRLAGLDGYFSNITTGCEVSQGKPDPEIYLLAAQRLGVEAHSCLAFEDSNNGVKAAVAANMITLQIPDLVEPCQEVLAFGHAIHADMSAALHSLQRQ
ncbi:HAD family hydrolase [Vibrio sp.]|uniref:HAD family hydrolase n=1 Tax=Vibrio sp. TaxID=678 RepID=UPI003D147BA0